ncbi:hypothetical protein HMI55_005542, partial [Coelomomyces lativittatus]
MFEKCENTTKRLEIASLLKLFFIKVIQTDSKVLLSCVYLCINKLCPDFEGLELGIGESILIKAIAESTGRTLQKIKDDLAEIGDLGEVAQASRGTQSTMFRPKPLTINGVFKTLKEIASVTGNSSFLIHSLIFR